MLKWENTSIPIPGEAMRILETTTWEMACCAAFDDSPNLLSFSSIIGIPCWSSLKTTSKTGNSSGDRWLWMLNALNNMHGNAQELLLKNLETEMKYSNSWEIKWRKRLCNASYFDKLNVRKPVFHENNWSVLIKVKTLNAISLHAVNHEQHMYEFIISRGLLTQMDELPVLHSNTSETAMSRQIFKI